MRRVLGPVLLLTALASARADTGDAASLSELKQLSIDQLMNTEVTSVSSYPEKLRQTASAIQVISDEDIRRYGATNLPEALQLADNLDVDQKNPHDWAISARGFDSNNADKMLVLIDGRSVYTPLFAGVFWNAQDYLLADLDQIEVISGPGGTLFGANAVNGVINITTKNARDTQGGYAEAGLGNDHQQYFGLRYGGQVSENVYYRAYAKFLRQGDADSMDGQALNDSWSQSLAGFRVDATPVQNQALTVSGDIYTGNLNILGSGDARLAGGNLIGCWSRTSVDGGGTNVEVYYDRTYLDDPFPDTGFAPAGDLRDDLTTLDAELKQDFRLGDLHHLAWGLGYRWTDDRVLQEAPNVAFLPPHLEQGLASVFLQDEIQVLPDWFLTLGSKLEHNPFTGLEYEPTARLRYQLTPRETLWAAVSRAVRAPSRFDRDLAEPAPPNALILGNPAFESETVIAYEAGWRSQVSSQASLSTSVFYNQYNDLRALSPTPTTFLPVVFTNGLAGHTYGAEVAGMLQVAPGARLHAGYDWLRERLGTLPGQSNLYGTGIDSETEDPRNQVFVRGSFDLPLRLELDPSYRWIDALQDNDGPTTTVVPAYGELDIRLGWRASPQLNFAVVGQNLLHPRHPEYGLPSTTREEVPRSFYVKTVYRF